MRGFVCIENDWMNDSLVPSVLRRVRATLERWTQEGQLVSAAALQLNLVHLKTAAWVLCLLNMAHVLVFALVLGSTDPVRTQWANGVAWAHATMAALMLGMGAMARQGLRHHATPRHVRRLPDITALAVLAWAVALTLVDQAVTTNISPYLNACAGVAIVLLLPPLRALVLFTLAWALLAWGLGLVSTDPATLLTNRVNAATASVLAMMVSVLLWRKYTQTELLQRALADTNQVLKQQRAELETLATRDPLTGLLNRREFLHQAEQECARAQRDHSPLSLLMMDLDHFKTINDRFGHPVGDAVLRHVARLMTQSVRQTDRVARFGGEEFMVLLPNTDAASAHVLADKLRRTLIHTPTPWPQTGAGHDIPITTSIGLICQPAGQNHSLDLLLARVDQALYRAKTQGRNRVEEMAAPASDDSVINN